MLNFSILLVFITFALCYLFKPQWRGKANQPSLPPGPKPWPIVGNLPELIKSKKKTSVSHWIHSFMKEMNTEIACIRLGNVHVILVTCPEISREFFKKQDAVFASRPLTMATDVISKGHLSTVFAPVGDQWKKMKRVMVSVEVTITSDLAFDGDSNTAFFLIVVKVREKKRSIHGMKFGTRFITEPRALRGKMFEFFKNHFSCRSRNWWMIFNLEFKRITVADARKLEEPLKTEEMKKAIWSCDDSKAPCPDGDLGTDGSFLARLITLLGRLSCKGLKESFKFGTSEGVALELEMRSGLVNLRVAARHYCGNVMRKLMFNQRYFGEGKADGGPGFEEEEYIEAIFTSLAYVYSFSVSDYLPFLRGLDLEGHETIVGEATRVLNKYHDPIIEDRIHKWRDGKIDEPQDLLDVLVSLTNDNGISLLSENEIKAQICEIMLAAVDNPSNALEWALAEMLNKPEMLQKALDELDNVVGRDRLVQESDFPQLNYVKACAREAFRLHPISPFIPPHVSVADTTVADYFIPKGSYVVLTREGLGQNAKVWDDPCEFKPERHLQECNEGKEVVLAEPELRFLSFSRGRRGCPGLVLGSSMTIMLFARLLQGFDWSIPSNQGAIDLSQGKRDSFLAKPLLAIAKPRLPPHVYSFWR
ncbi:hypothetical protein GQ457_02G005150 [Hibiscus cannabinus]